MASNRDKPCVTITNPDISKVCGSHDHDESSDSDGETEPARAFHRRISTNKDIKTSACTKDGYLMKQNPFQRWRKRYFKLKGRRLYYARDHASEIFNEIELSHLSVAEKSTKNINHSFQVITPSRNLVLCAESRKEMEDWIFALKAAATNQYYDPKQEHREMTSGLHNWFACSHARPIYCNVCRDALPGMTSHGLSCEVCKFKAHKRCAVRASTMCKWTTLASVGQEIIEDEEGISMPHQWVEGNLPVSAKCVVCDRPCGSVLRLQDWRCLWCRALVHSGCLEQHPVKCPLGQCRISILPPSAINSTDSDGYWEAMRPPGSSPLLVFVNTKSGNNQGVKFLRRFKQLLNPAQVFDLMNGGPYAGLRLFQKFDPFRILVCGGDGSIGWVLSEIDKLDLHRQCQIGVLPFGTGNDLARVLGWGHAIDDDQQLPQILEKLEHSQIKMLDRWSVYTFEGMVAPSKIEEEEETNPISQYEDNVASHLTKILHSGDHEVVISSAKVLCQTIKDFVSKVAGSDQSDDEKQAHCMAGKCSVLNEKLESLLKTLNHESMASKQVPDPQPSTPPQEYREESIPTNIQRPKVGFKQHDSLMCRANSLKKAIRQIIEHTEKAVDEQNAQTEHHTHDVQQHTQEEAAQRQHKDIQMQPQPEREPLLLPPERDHRQSGSLGSLLPSSVSHSAPSITELNQDSPLQTPTMKKSELTSPRVSSRRISKMSTFNKSASVGSNLYTKDPVLLPQLTLNTHRNSGMLVPPSTTRMSMLPGLSSSIAGRLAGGSFISKVLLANADALCAAASPLIEEEIPLEEYTEKCVMNNYFGIGLDAKISLEFNNRRDEHPENFRSRTKNFMWYSVLGGREILHRTYKNFHQRVQLECDGQKIPLPSLQGIVVLNIPSYAGGTNFWGGKKENDNFSAPNFDDKILEVVAVFGTAQIAMSRVIDIQRHRIAQCRTVKITIMGEEGVPVQADGEAWIQPPGYIRIVHKNRAQMLNRDRRSVAETIHIVTTDPKLNRDRGRYNLPHVIKSCDLPGSDMTNPAMLWKKINGYRLIKAIVISFIIKSTFETIWRMWSEKQKMERQIVLAGVSVTDEEITTLQNFVDASSLLINSVKLAATSHTTVDHELLPIALMCEKCLNKLYPSGKLVEIDPVDVESEQPTLRLYIDEFVTNIKNLYRDTTVFLSLNSPAMPLCPEYEDKLNSALAQTEVELRKVVEVIGISSSNPAISTLETQSITSEHKHRKPGKLKQVIGRFKGRTKERDHSICSIPQAYNVHQWTIDDVANWLESLSLQEYRDSFVKHEISGEELLSLERRDLKDLGVHKVGHMKRLQQGIKQLSSKMVSYERSTHM